MNVFKPVKQLVLLAMMLKQTDQCFESDTQRYTFLGNQPTVSYTLIVSAYSTMKRLHTSPLTIQLLNIHTLACASAIQKDNVQGQTKCAYNHFLACISDICKPEN